MEIRRRLSFQFILTVALIMLLSFISIYISVSQFRKETFYNQLENRARSVAQLLIDVEEIDAELLKKIEKASVSNLPDEIISIYDFRNELLFSTDDKKYLSEFESKLDEVRLKEYIRFRKNNIEVLGIYYKSKYDRFVVLEGARDISGLERLKNLQFILIIVFLLSLIIVFLAGEFLSGRALHPIQQVIRQVDEIGVSNLDQRVNEGNGKDEIARLAFTFNKMLERLESAFMMQKSFIANASHELRTPLTMITGQLEVTLLSDRSVEEYRKVIRSVLDDITILNTVSNRLLLLAHTSSDIAKLNFSSVRIDDLLWSTRQEMLKKFPDFSVHINIDPNLDDEILLTVTGNESLLKTAFSNIIENASKYSPLDKSVFIDIKPGREMTVIAFRDKGIGVPEEDLKMIFQPFYRGKNSLEFSGHGIGLSLAERIVNIHSGSLEVRSILGKGSEFIIKLPLTHHHPH
jgi:signal transduction histidine kinase